MKVKRVIQLIVNLIFSATVLTLVATIACRVKGVADGSTESFYFTEFGYPNSWLIIRDDNAGAFFEWSNLAINFTIFFVASLIIAVIIGLICKRKKE